MKKKIYILLVALISFVLFVWGALYLNERLFQGEYYHYEDGVTIEVTNSSDEELTNLSFIINPLFQDLGSIRSLEPKESISLYTPAINKVGNDRSLYLKYLNNQMREEQVSLAYLASYNPIKIVVILDITGKDHMGRFLYRVKGFDDVSHFEYEITTHEDN